ncbi:MAG TPA: FecR domain-containing protein [Planctomicrobium sp.]|nr:FecR domain-containing protein [Planctomicrobium sp.]
MNPQEDHRKLLNYLAGTLQPEEVRELERQICELPEVADCLIELAYDEYFLVEWGGSTGYGGNSPALSVQQQPSRTALRKIRRWLLLPVLSMAITLLLILQADHKLDNVPELPLHVDTPQVNHAPHSAPVTLSTGEVVSPNIEQTLPHGFVELLFPTGAKVFITAPAVYEVTGENSIRLQKGNFVANVPESGYGFQVDTPSGRLVDLGTVFSVHASENEETHLQVIRGKVIASLTNDRGGVRKSREIQENQAVKIDREQDEISETPYFNVISRKYGITHHTHTVAFQEQMPDVLATGKYQVFEHDNLAFVFPERANVTLPEHLQGDLDSPRPEQTAEELMSRRRDIPAGTTVDCFRVYYDPVNRDGEGAFIPVQGEIHFARPIVGILLSPELLKKTDQLFHPLCEYDPNCQFLHQGTEIDNTQVDQTGKYDVVSISEDRKRLTFLLKSGTRFVDEFRVLIESAESQPISTNSPTRP